MRNSGMTSVPLLRLSDAITRTAAQGLPGAVDGGFSVVTGPVVGDFATPQPRLVFIADAEPLAHADSAAGRLRAELLEASLGADLTDLAASYVMVAKPAPGVLVGTEGGPRAGLWFGALYSGTHSR
jgi:hypothetical protein